MSKAEFVARHFPRASVPPIEQLELSEKSFTEAYNRIPGETPTEDGEE